MGITLQGKTYATTSDILADIEARHTDYQKGFSAAKDREESAWKQYRALQLETNRAHLKAIYVEALKEGKSLDWAEGKAAGKDLKESELQDDELHAIKELFS